MNVIITGAGKGIGFALLKAFAQDSGNRIIAISRNMEQINSFIIDNEKENRLQNVFPITFDLENQDINSELLPEIKKIFSEIDLLINNAGALINKPFKQLNSSDFDKMFAVNVKSPFLLSKALIPLFIRNSHIVNISSMGGVQGSVKFKGLSLYSSSKAALAVLTECMALELDEFKIKVNCLALGAVQTEMLSNAFPGYKAPVKDYEIANYIKDFAQTAHHYMNGKIISVALTNP